MDNYTGKRIDGRYEIQEVIASAAWRSFIKRMTALTTG